MTTMKIFRLFDCDDTLFLSETLAFQACCSVINKVLASKNVRESDGSLKRFTPEALKKRFVGHNCREIILLPSKEYPPFDITPEEVEQAVADELAAVTAILREKAEKTRGIDAVLAKYQAAGDILAVVSSSAMVRVRACLERGDMLAVFGVRVYSAASSLPEPTSKPHPAVYLFSMNDLGAEPHQCIAYEDSVSGVTSAVAAGIKVVGYVGALPEDKQADRIKALLDAGAAGVITDWKDVEQFDAI